VYTCAKASRIKIGSDMLSSAYLLVLLMSKKSILIIYCMLRLKALQTAAVKLKRHDD